MILLRNHISVVLFSFRLPLAALPVLPESVPVLQHSISEMESVASVPLSHLIVLLTVTTGLPNTFW